MKAFQVKKYSKTEKLQAADVNDPKPKENEVLVQIHAAGVNLLDSLIRNGEFKIFLPYKPPFINGHDMAGVVTKLGPGVSKFKVGDEVYARVADFRIGTFAEYIAAHEDDLALKPMNLSMEEAAIPLVGLTAWQSLIKIAGLKKGQKVFIQAGSGGVGTFAIQLAKHAGAFVATTTSTANIDWVKQLGADLVIDYKKDDFSTLLKDYDVVLHSHRDKKVLEQSLNVLREGGTLVSLTGPPTPDFARQVAGGWPLRLLTGLLSRGTRQMARKRKVNYAFLFMQANGMQLSRITSLIESGEIRPVIDKVFPFEQANDALTYVESGRAKGKVVIRL